MKTRTRIYPIVSRRFIDNTTIAVVLCIIFGCSKDDGPEPQTILPPPIVEEQTIFGKWEITSGRLLIDNSKFVHINEDNTMNVLSGHEMGSKGETTTNITVSEENLSISTSYGSENHNYTLVADKLTITLPREEGEVKLSRNNTIPDHTDWVKVLTVLDEGDSPWPGIVDIAFNGTHILYGARDGGKEIGLVNPSNFNLDDTISTISFPYVVEVEKYDSPDRYIFHAGGSTKFFANREDDNSQALESIDIGSGISGLASVDETQIWVASYGSKSLKLYRYDTHEIVTNIELDFSPIGIDYQDGYLFICDGRQIHKYETQPTLKNIESYRIQNHRVIGVTHDGSNFWMNTQTNSGDYKLIKVNLSI